MPPSENVFLVPHQEGYLVWAPLTRRLVHVNAGCAAQLKRYLECGDPGVVDDEVVERLGGLRWLDDQPEPVPLPADRHFHPITVTLFVTSGCNLRCSYCYASAGDEPAEVMPAEVYRAAIDLVAANARRAGRLPGLGFHGGGEPTTAWKTLMGAVEYARSVTGHDRLGAGLATNGVMSAARAEEVAATFSHVTLSLDGPQETHDAQRRLADGSGTFDRVMAFVDTLRRQETPFAIRATVTELNVDRLAELVDFFVDQTGCTQLHFEPVFASGRRRAGGTLSPEAYTEGFIAAMQRAARRGARLRYSAARLVGPFLTFCGCAEDAFNVTPDGGVTACFEVCRRDSPLAADFFYGELDRSRGRFNIDFERLARLRRLNVQHKPVCRRCFARWTCSGDCPIKIGGTNELDYGGTGPRCQVNRAITKAMLVQALSSGAHLLPSRP